MSSAFVDVDGTSIAATAPPAHLADLHGTIWYRARTLAVVGRGRAPAGAREELTVAVATEPSEDDAERLVAWLRGGSAGAASALGHAAGWVVGIDTESGPRGDVCALQLCLGLRVVVVRAPRDDKAALSTFALVELLGNAGSGLLFAGAELAGDAVDLAAATRCATRLHGALDFTPHYADLARPEGDTVGLRQIVDAVLAGAGAPSWVKDKSVTCSDWSAPRLTLAQVKYAALDAWASARVGCCVVGKAPSPVALSREVFTLRGLSPRAINQLTRILDQAEALKLAQVKSHEVTLEGTTFERDAPRILTLRMRDYDRRLRRGNPVTVVMSPRPALNLQKRGWAPAAAAARRDAAVRFVLPFHGPVRIASGEVTNVCGKTAIVQLDAGSGISGEDVYRTSSVNLRAVAVLTNTAGERDCPLEAAEAWVTAAVRGHTVHSARGAGFPDRVLPHWPVPAAGRTPLGLRFALALLGDGGRVPTALPAGASGGGAGPVAAPGPAWARAAALLRAAAAPNGAAVAPHLLTAAASTLRTALPQAAAFAVSGAEAELNGPQVLALLAAHTHVVTAVRGPPGTGKTRVIAAMCASFAARDDVGRVLVLAPSNAATKRILESLLAAGVHDAALVVSREYYFEWHEEAYAAGGVDEYVVTPESAGGEGDGGGDGASTRDGGGTFASARSGGGYSRRSGRTFGGRSGGGGSGAAPAPRIVFARASKWTRRGRNGVEPPMPRIVIMSHGSFANATLAAGPGGTADAVRATTAGPARGGDGGDDVLSGESWSAVLRRVVHFATLRAVIVDEVSQLWSGHMLHLCATAALGAVARLVLVGDEHQLPPFGEDEAGATSVFDALLAHADVPVIELSATYRLPAPLCDELSRRVYGGRLHARRNAGADASFARALDAGLALLESGPNGRAYAAEAAALRRLLGSQGRAGAPPAAAAGVAWADVRGGAESVGDGGSMVNAVEATAAARLAVAARLAFALAAPHGAAVAHRVVTLTFYKQQQLAIEGEIESAFASLVRDPLLPNSALLRGAVRSAKLVTTTDGFQGQEADLVLVSTVRTRPALTDFMRDYRRCNVALSRASHALLFVGDHASLAAVPHDRPGHHDEPSAPAYARGSLLTHFAARCAAAGAVFPLGVDGGSGDDGGGAEPPPLRADALHGRRRASRGGGVRFAADGDGGSRGDGGPSPPWPPMLADDARGRPEPREHEPREPRRGADDEPREPRRAARPALPPPLPPSPPPPPAYGAGGRRPPLAAAPPPEARSQQPAAVVGALRDALASAWAAGGNGFATAAQLGQVLAQHGLTGDVVGKLSEALAALPGVECVRDENHGQHMFRIVNGAPRPQRARAHPPQPAAAPTAVAAQPRTGTPTEGDVVAAALHVLTVAGRGTWVTGQVLGGAVKQRLAAVGLVAARRGTLLATLRGADDIECFDDGGDTVHFCAPALPAPPAPPTDDDVVEAARAVLRAEPAGEWVPLLRLGERVAAELRARGLLRHEPGSLARTLQASGAHVIASLWGPLAVAHAGADGLFRLRRAGRAHD